MLIGITLCVHTIELSTLLDLDLGLASVLSKWVIGMIMFQDYPSKWPTTTMFCTPGFLFFLAIKTIYLSRAVRADSGEANPHCPISVAPDPLTH